MRVIVIGIDGATFKVIRPLVKEGKLPAFKKLLKEGASGILNTVIPSLSAPCWATITTGKNPGKTGIFDFVRMNKNYEFKLNSSVDKKAPEIWDLIHGKSVVINVLLSYPPKKINGWMVTGMNTPGIESNFTYPPKLKKEILQKIPNYKIDINWEIYQEQQNKFLEYLFEMTENRIKLIELLLKKDWDLFFAVFTGCDRLQHFLFGTEFVEKYYKKIDSLLREIIKLLSEDTVLLVISDHGFEPLKKIFHGNSFLKKEGFLKVRSRSIKERILLKLGLTKENAIRLLHSLNVDPQKVMVKFSFKIKNILPERSDSLFQNVSWANTSAFIIGGGQVYINLEGRFLKGCVKKEDYEKVREELIKKFESLRDDGVKVVRKVYRREELYPGPYMEQGPDLILDYNEGYSFKIKISENVLEKHKYMKGKHNNQGIFLAFGKKIKKTKVQANLADIAPTILWLLGEKIPEDMDGRVLTEICEKPAPKTSSAKKTKKEVKEVFDEKDKERIKARLKALGYLD